MTSLRTRREAMPSAVWWTPRRSRSSRSSWPQKRPGRSQASWWRQAAGPVGRYFTSQRLECVFIDFFNVESGPAAHRLCSHQRRGQTLDAQLEQLRGAGCTKIFREKVTGAHSDRRELLKMLKGLAPNGVGDQP